MKIALLRGLRIMLSCRFKEFSSHIIPALHIGPPFSFQLISSVGLN